MSNYTEADVERWHDNVLEMFEGRERESAGLLADLGRLKAAAMEGAKVPGLVAERDSALDMMRSTKATLRHLGDTHEISEHAYQELACHLDDEPCGHDGERITTRSEREVSALQARVAELEGERHEAKELEATLRATIEDLERELRIRNDDHAVEQDGRLKAESERDALRAQVEAVGPLLEWARLTLEMRGAEDGANTRGGAVVLDVRSGSGRTRVTVDDLRAALSSPPAETTAGIDPVTGACSTCGAIHARGANTLCPSETTPAPKRAESKRSCFIHADCDAAEREGATIHRGASRK